MFSTIPKVLKDTKEFQNAHVIPTGGEGAMEHVAFLTICQSEQFA